jgi:hypothetical protein
MMWKRGILRLHKHFSPPLIASWLRVGRNGYGDVYFFSPQKYIFSLFGKNMYKYVGANHYSPLHRGCSVVSPLGWL